MKSTDTIELIDSFMAATLSTEGGNLKSSLSLGQGRGTVSGGCMQKWVIKLAKYKRNTKGTAEGWEAASSGDTSLLCYRGISLYLIRKLN